MIAKGIALETRPTQDPSLGLKGRDARSWPCLASKSPISALQASDMCVRHFSRPSAFASTGRPVGPAASAEPPLLCSGRRYTLPLCIRPTRCPAPGSTLGPTGRDPIAKGNALETRPPKTSHEARRAVTDDAGSKRNRVEDAAGQTDMTFETMLTNTSGSTGFCTYAAAPPRIARLCSAKGSRPVTTTIGIATVRTFLASR